MSMYYDQEMFQSFRALAVTEVEDLKIGAKYYSTCYGFKTGDILTEIISQQEHDIREGRDNPSEDTEPKWMVFGSNIWSLSDRNIGNSYNPWLVFENQNLAIACNEMLKITYGRDDWSWDSDFWNDGYDDYDYGDEQ